MKMAKRLKKVTLVLLVSVVVSCDQYEFPSTEYPTVITEPLGTVTQFMATFNGFVRRHGTSAVTRHGFVWGTDDPNVETSNIVDLGPLSDDSFSTTVNFSFPYKQTFNVRAFAITDSYTSYGSIVQFRAGD